MVHLTPGSLSLKMKALRLVTALETLKPENLTLDIWAPSSLNRSFFRKDKYGVRLWPLVLASEIPD